MAQHAWHAFNPDPDRWDGILLPFEADDLVDVIPEVLFNRTKVKNVTMAKVELTTGEYLYAVNDLFVGPKSHTSARYTIQVGADREQQSSSGIIISTGLGSTGWLRSIVAGATGITQYLMGRALTIDDPGSVSWDTEYLYYTVREPFPSRTTSATMTFGKITQSDPMYLVSQMPENGVIFSDGVEDDFLEFNSGTIATIRIAEKQVNIII